VSSGPVASRGALSISGVSKRFGELEALHDVSFEAAAGEVLAVIGPNGAGKTTLLSIIAGVQRPSAGSVRLAAAGGETGAPDGKVGWVPQQPAVYSKLSVRENLELFARLERVADPGAAVERMLAQAGLSARADELVQRLSGGNRQRVNVAIGLIADPPVLVLDEPSASLDPGQRERLWQFLGALTQRGTSVLFSTHTVDEAQRFANRVIVLDQGRLLFDGPPAELMRRSGADADGDFERALLAFLEAHGR
jgi:ABC-2 type transport system ATP-binding protein